MRHPLVRWWEQHPKVRTGLAVIGKLLLFEALPGVTAFLVYFVAIAEIPINGLTGRVLVCMSFLVFSYIFCKHEKPKPFTLGLRLDLHNLRWMVFGVLIGILIQSVNFAYRIVFCGLVFDWNPYWNPYWNPTIYLYSAFYTWVSAMIEELTRRGYPLLLLMPRVGVLGALTITSVVFALDHFSNRHIPNDDYFIAMLFYLISGYLYGVAFLASKTLWLPIAIHTTGNFMLYPIYHYEGRDWIHYRGSVICSVSVVSNLSL